MCGLVGIVDPSRKKTKADSHRMALAIAHRGPDDHTDWQDESLPVYLSFRRLAILDLSPEGNQPMHDGPLTITFNGEIYNYKELKARLADEHGCVFKTTSDTEVLLKAFLVWGVEETLALVNGMFGIALLDRRDGSITLMRDRFGEKPLYHMLQDGIFYFASELKALRTQDELKASKAGLSCYLQFGFIPAPITIYEGVTALRPGQWKRFSVETLLETATGITPRYEAAAPVPQKPSAALDVFETALGNAIDIRLRSDVPLGVFLSGGLDSSLILLMASKKLGKALPSFTIKMKGGDDAYDESLQAANIAALCGSKNHVLTLDEKALLKALPDQIKMMDQPLADAAILPTALLSQFARKTVTVVLGGEGGDELQAGYTRHAQEQKLKTMFTLRVVAKALLPLARKLAPYVEKLKLPQLPRQIDKLEQFTKGEGRSAYLALMTLWPQKYDLKLPNDFRAADTVFYLPDDLLMKLDGAAMGASLEGRCPYLDPELWTALSGIPRMQWADKKLAKKLLVKLGGPDALPQGKRGLTLPLADWMRDGLKPWAQENLDYFKTLNLIPDEDVETKWQAIQNGTSQHAQPIWALCVFSAWCRAHNLAI